MEDSLELNNPGMGLVRVSEAEQLPAEVETIPIAQILAEQQIAQRGLNERGYIIVGVYKNEPSKIGDVIDIDVGTGEGCVPIGRVVLTAEATFEEATAEALRLRGKVLTRAECEPFWFYRAMAE